MLTFITLCTFTDQGIRTIKDSTKRADMAMEAASKFGSKMTHLYWTQGQFDLIAILEAPDEESATALGLAIAAGGNVRMQTLRAFDKTAMNTILSKLG
jgi:uncharacterized protein with GYD domain